MLRKPRVHSDGAPLGRHPSPSPNYVARSVTSQKRAGPGACRCHVRVAPLRGLHRACLYCRGNKRDQKKQVVQAWAAFASRCCLQKIALVAADLVDPGPSTLQALPCSSKLARERDTPKDNRYS